MARPGTFEVRGLRDLLVATDAYGGNVKKLTRDEFRKVAEPVRAAAQAKFGWYDERSAGGYRVVVRRTGWVTVEQRFGRTTGQHPEFGRLQMRRALLPALSENQDEIERGLENALERIANIWEAS